MVWKPTFDNLIKIGEQREQQYGKRKNHRPKNTEIQIQMRITGNAVKPNSHYDCAAAAFLLMLLVKAFPSDWNCCSDFTF